ncbi:MAG: DUF924 family protein [Bradymonadia bacterium]
MPELMQAGFDYEDVLGFWFEEVAPSDWFQGGATFDALVKERLAEGYEAAAAGQLDEWKQSADGCLALCILLDQVPRNIFRGDPKSYATDADARAVTHHALAHGFDLQLESDDQRAFMYLPLEHSENLEDQKKSVSLFDERTDSELYQDYARRHLVVVERFGRFPHRNAILGRTPTEEEAEWLAGRNTPF